MLECYIIIAWKILFLEFWAWGTWPLRPPRLLRLCRKPIIPLRISENGASLCVWHLLTVVIITIMSSYVCWLVCHHALTNQPSRPSRINHSSFPPARGQQRSWPRRDLGRVSEIRFRMLYLYCNSCRRRRQWFMDGQGKFSSWKSLLRSDHK